MKKHAFTAVSLVLLSSGCGYFSKSSSGSENAQKGGQKISVSLGLSERTEAANQLLLSAVTNDYQIAISGCSSGFVSTITSTTALPVAAVSMYAFDTSCLAGLVNFTVGGLTYTKQGGGSLTTGSALFSEGGGGLYNVTLGNQLPSPLTSGANAKFVFEQVKLGANYAVSGYSVSEALQLVGVDAPNVKVQNATLTAIAAGTGNPTFSIAVECNVASQTAGAICPSENAELQNFVGMKAKLVPDTFSGVLTIADAQTIMTAGSTTVVAGDIGGAVIGTNDGFTVSLTQSVGTLTANKNMILIVSFSDVSGATSYRYFNFDIGNPI